MISRPWLSMRLLAVFSPNGFPGYLSLQRLLIRTLPFGNPARFLLLRTCFRLCFWRLAFHGSRPFTKHFGHHHFFALLASDKAMASACFRSVTTGPLFDPE